jgi:cysteine desulfurase/selenocysteine lyase
MVTGLDTGQDAREGSPTDLEVEQIREGFPILRVPLHGKPLIYLDNAATAQKPQTVLDALQRYYATQNASVHRGVHYLSELATDLFEGARKRLQRFLGAHLACEIIFTRGATEGINLVAHAYGRQHVRAGDEVLISALEHHSNLVPWQMLCEERGATLRVIPITDEGTLRLDEFEKLLNKRTKIVAVTHVSNALGTINPIQRIIETAHAIEVPVLIDGAQSAPHMPIRVEELGCDFYVCSGHKMLGPTGIGVLYGRAELLEAMPPWHGGGDMILSVTFEKTRYKGLPWKFEAGTPHVAGALGLAAAVDYLERIGMRRVAAYERELLAYGTNVLRAIDGLGIIGNAPEKAGILSFVMDCAHPHDIGQILDDEGIAIRAGHHCAQPLMERLGVPATARASLALYNTRQDLDALAGALLKVKEVFG